MGFAGGAGFAVGAANFVDASGAFKTAVAGVTAGAAGAAGLATGASFAGGLTTVSVFAAGAAGVSGVL